MDTVATLGSLSAIGTSIAAAAWAIWSARKSKSEGKLDFDIIEINVSDMLHAQGVAQVVIPLRPGESAAAIRAALDDALEEAQVIQKLEARAKEMERERKASPNAPPDDH